MNSINDIKQLVGNTPMIKITYEYNKKIMSLYSKLEYYNLSGSIKDRIAMHIMERAIDQKKYKPGQPIVEVTSGNTGIAFCALGAYLGSQVHIIMPDWCSKERKAIMENFGAKLYLVSKEEGGFKECLNRSQKMIKQLKAFCPYQFENNDNVDAHYLYTGKEIIKKLPNVSTFCSGIGTGGTIMGIGKCLKQHNPKTKIIAFEPDGLPIITKGATTGSHKIEGIGDDFIPKIVDLKMFDKILTINDMDAINMSKKLSKELGLGVGISSGANFLACVLNNVNGKEIVCTVFADDNKKYITTDLFKKDLPVDKKMISQQIKLIKFEYVK